MVAFYAGNQKNKREQVAEIRSQQNEASVGSTSNQVYRHRRSLRFLFLTILILIGFFVLAGSGSKTTGIPAHARDLLINDFTPLGSPNWLMLGVQTG
jgi:hypothetical protein